MVNPTYRENLLAANDAMILQNSAALTQANAGAVATELNGARPVETGRVLDSFNQFSAGQQQAIFGYKADQFGSYLQAELSGDRQFYDRTTGRNFTGAEAQSSGRLYNIAANDVMGGFMRENGFTSLSPQYTAKGLESIRKTMVSGLKKAEKNEIAAQKSATLLRSSQTLLSAQDPTAAVSDLLASKAALNRANDYDWEKTTRGVLEKVYARDSRGEYIMNPNVREAVLNTPGWGPNGESLGSYKMLNAEFQNTSRKARINAHKDDKQIAELEGEEFWESKRESLKASWVKVIS